MLWGHILASSDSAASLSQHACIGLHDDDAKLLFATMGSGFY